MTKDEAKRLEEEEFLLERRRRGKPHGHAMPGEDISALNLTPLMDIMTILLVFLIQSLAAEPSNINVSLDLRPPESSATRSMESATRVTITTEEILVESNVVMPSKALLAAADAQGVVGELRNALAAEEQKIRSMEQYGGGAFEGKLLIVAHQSTPYAMVSTVLTTAGFAHFSQFKLVVMKKGSE